MRRRSRSVQRIGVQRFRLRRVRRSGGGTWVFSGSVAAIHCSGAAFRCSGEPAREHLGEVVALTLALQVGIPAFRSSGLICSGEAWYSGELARQRACGTLRQDAHRPSYALAP
jgi:hypothetical protein